MRLGVCTLKYLMYLEKKSVDQCCDRMDQVFLIGLKLIIIIHYM